MYWNGRKSGKSRKPRHTRSEVASYYAGLRAGKRIAYKNRSKPKW